MVSILQSSQFLATDHAINVNAPVKSVKSVVKQQYSQSSSAQQSLS
jgi:hypothetical protein